MLTKSLGSFDRKAVVENHEARMLQMQQVECPLTHRFEPGVYIREIFMPKGATVIGHEHKTSHWNIIIRGKVLVSCHQEISRLEAPHCFRSGVGVRKVLYIIEDTIWQTLHPTTETDLDKLEKELIVKSETFEKFAADQRALQDALVNENLLT